MHACCRAQGPGPGPSLKGTCLQAEHNVSVGHIVAVPQHKLSLHAMHATLQGRQRAYGTRAGVGRVFGRGEEAKA